MSKNYKRYSQANGDPIQVDSAIRDGNGKNIANNYAKQNGFYSGLTSGLAVNIKTNQGATVTDAIAKLDPISVAVEDGDFASMTNFKGRSFAYNQIKKGENLTTSSNGVTLVSSTDGSWTLSGTATGGNFNFVTWVSGMVSGHKYLVCAIGFTGSASTKFIQFFGTLLLDNAMICTANATGGNIQYYCYSGNGDSKKYYPQIFDLTAMGISTTDVSEAIAALKSYNIDPSVYNEYSPGKIIDSQPNKIISRGFNQWDEQWEVGDLSSATGQEVVSSSYIRGKNYIRCIPNITYYGYTGGENRIWLYWYDKDKKYIRNTPQGFINTTVVSPDNAYYFRLVELATSYTNDICINISNTALNGTYKPYVANEYTITAPVMRSAGSVADDKDNVKVGQVDLGTLNYGKQYADTDHEQIVTSELASVIKTPSASSVIANMTCANYIPSNSDSVYNHSANNIIAVGPSGNVTIYSSVLIGKTPAEIKTALSGFILNYELKTPVPQTDLVLPTNIITYNGGTLETQYTSPNTTPGLVSMLYQVNLKNFIESLGAREDINFQPNEITSHDELEEAQDDTYNKAKDDLEKGNLIPSLSDNLTPYSDESGNLQTIPFVMQGTGCGNGESVIDTGSFAQLKEKRGNSVVVNQLVQNGTFVNTSNWSYWSQVSTFSASNNEMTVTSAGSGCSLAQSLSQIIPSGNKVIISFDAKSNDLNDTLYFQFYNGSSLVSTHETNSAVSTSYKRFHILVTLSNQATRIQFYRSLASGSIVYRNIVIHNLTQWFGSNDRIPSYLLAHPEDFGRYYSGSLAYNAGTIVDSNARYLKTIGRNQWDEVWEKGYWDVSNGNPVSTNSQIRSKNYIKVIPSGTYYFKAPFTVWVLQYDSNKNYLGIYTNRLNNTLTLKANTHYIKFYTVGDYGATYNHDITISIYYEDESGYDKYYSYKELENVDTGTEVLRSAGSVYDVKKPSGEITRNVKAYTFTGEETVSSRTVGEGLNGFEITGITIDWKPETLNITNNFNLVARTNVYSSAGIELYSSKIYISFSSSMGIDTTAKCIAFLTGKTMNYELATPTTEQGTSFQENIKIDDFGSMKWDNESFNGVPQGNAIFYPVDYKAFLDSLNNYTDGDVTNLVLNTDNIDMSKIVDSHGNARFVEGAITSRTVSGYTFTYNKWSLSGTHLLIVLEGNITANTTLADNTELAVMQVPNYVLDKINILSSKTVTSKAITCFKQGSPWVTETLILSLDKKDGKLYIKNNSGNQTIANNAAFRIQFDLLIDTD